MYEQKINGWTIRVKTERISKKHVFEVSARRQVTTSFSDRDDAERYATERRP